MWSNVKEPTIYVRNKPTKIIHLGVATRSSTGGNPHHAASPIMVPKKRTRYGHNIPSMKETNQEHTSTGRHKIFNKWETHTMQQALNGPDKKNGYGVMSRGQHSISERNQEHTSGGSQQNLQRSGNLHNAAK